MKRNWFVLNERALTGCGLFGIRLFQHSIDVSFISLKIVVPAVRKFLKDGARILALIKPQFEVGKTQVGKGGVVRDSTLHNRVIESLSDFFVESDFACETVIPSPILGPKGNREFFILLRHQPVVLT